MRLICSNCGAPLKGAADQTIATCSYCQAVTRLQPPSPQAPASARSPGAGQARIVVGLTVGALLVTGVIAAIIAQSGSRRTIATVTTGGEAATPAPELLVTEAHEVETAAPDEAAIPDGQGADDDVRQEPADAAAVPSGGTKARKSASRSARAPTGPVSSKKDAQQVLEPEVLSCMKEHGVHYLITRLGNKRKGATVPPLGLTGTSVVDYKPTPGFARTPLGRCVARAARAVRAPAYGGDYIYLGLRHDAVPDPLAAAPARLDAAAAKQALSALDDEARDCAARKPSGSRPGESVSVMVRFHGATGQVSDVRPNYVDKKSPYGRCLSSVYGKATVGKFREIEHKVMHVIQP